MQDFEQLDYYTLLGVEPSASPEAIKRAYRQQITRYHPDRYVNADAGEQEYAQQRAQRINEAYRVLGDAHARLAYNRGQRLPIAPPITPPPVVPHPPPTAAAPRDHQAELYAQASEHLVTGRIPQAVAALRQLQQINPFYRDSATLLAQAEAHMRETVATTPGPTVPAPENATPARTRRWLVTGAVGGTAALGLLAAALVWQAQASPPTAAPLAPTAVAALASTVAPTLSTTSSPALSPTTEPTTARRATLVPTAPPTVVPTLLPSPVLEEGSLRVDDSFENGVGWARSQQEGWSVGYADSDTGTGTVYQITAAPGVGNIWSYRTAPGSTDYSLGVDVLLVEPGSAGVLLRFQDRSNYLVCLITPDAHTFRVEERRNGRLNVIAEGALSSSVDVSTPIRLVTRISGSSLTMLVNGEVAAEERVAGLPDTPFYGLVAVAGEQRVVAQFDNLELRDIEPGS